MEDQDPKSTPPDHGARPLAGLVCLQASPPPAVHADPYRLEFLYLYPDECCTAPGPVFDFAPLQAKLADTASRGRQAVVRLNLGPSGEALSGTNQAARIPAWLQDHPDWAAPTVRHANGHDVSYPRWDQGAFAWFANRVIEAVGAALDGDVRVAYLQGFVGHWAEGHVWREATVEELQKDLGIIFPSPSQYKELLATATSAFKTVRWSVGISVGDQFYLQGANLQEYTFGSYNDTWRDLNPATQAWNQGLLDTLGRERWKRHPRGGEISYSSAQCQKSALERDQLREELKKDHMTYCLAFDQHTHRTQDELAVSSAAFGYDFRVHFTSSPECTTVVVANVGVAPISYPTFIQVCGVASTHDLAGLMPGQEVQCKVEQVIRSNDDISLVCARCLPGETIPFKAM